MITVKIVDSLSLYSVSISTDDWADAVRQAKYFQELIETVTNEIMKRRITEAGSGENG